MSFDLTIPGNNAQWAAAWTQLKQAHDALWQKLALLDDNLVLKIVSTAGKSLGSFKAGEIKFKFARINWSLVNAVPANGGVGATESKPSNMRKASDFAKWQGAETRILPAGLMGYAAWGAQGLNFLVLHETAHTTLLGLKSTLDCWHEHQDDESGDYGMTSEAWKKNERLANDIAVVVAGALGVPILAVANPGYDVAVPAAAPLAMTAVARTAKPSAGDAEVLALLDISGARSKPRKKAKPRKPPAKPARKPGKRRKPRA